MQQAKVEPSVIVECSACGATRSVSASWARRNAKNGTQARCPDCRRERILIVTTAHHRFWLERFTLQECAELYHAIVDDMPMLEQAMKAASGK